MAIITTPSPLDAIAFEIANQAHALAQTINAQVGSLYAKPISEILSILNEDVGKSISLIQLRQQAGNAINTCLDTLDSASFAERANVSMPEGISFDEELGQFVYTPPTPPVE